MSSRSRVAHHHPRARRAAGAPTPSPPSTTPPSGWRTKSTLPRFTDAAAPEAVAADGAEEAEPLLERTIPVEVDGKRYSVKLWLPEAAAGTATPKKRRRDRARAPAASGGAAGSGTISAPMQGTIVKVLVAEGEAVEVGQSVLVLEAMKMENHITAEKRAPSKRSGSPPATPSAPATSSSSSSSSAPSASASPGCDTVGVTSEPVRIAVVQRPPTLLDGPATIAAAVEQVHEVAAAGAGLVVFPEAYVPGYPVWIWHLRPGPDYALTSEIHAALLANASISMPTGSRRRGTPPPAPG